MVQHDESFSLPTVHATVWANCVCESSFQNQSCKSRSQMYYLLLVFPKGISLKLPEHKGFEIKLRRRVSCISQAGGHQNGLYEKARLPQPLCFSPKSCNCGQNQAKSEVSLP